MKHSLYSGILTLKGPLQSDSLDHRAFLLGLTYYACLTDILVYFCCLLVRLHLSLAHSNNRLKYGDLLFHICASKFLVVS